MRELPKKLEHRIVTTNVSTYLQHYDMSPVDYELFPVRSYTIRSNRKNAIDFKMKELYESLGDRMRKFNILAIADTRMETVSISVQGGADVVRVDLYGTAIIRNEHYAAMMLELEKPTEEKESTPDKGEQ